MEIKSFIWNSISWFFGILFFAIGVVNTFWGNDPFFGIFIVLLSFAFYPPVNVKLKEITGFRIHYVVKIVVGLFILWAALGVGELFDKVDMMLADIKDLMV